MCTLSLIQNCSLAILCIDQIKQNSFTSNEKTNQRNKPIWFWYLSQCWAMKALMSMCICLARVARSFAARFHKVVCRLKTKFYNASPLHHHECLNNAFASPNIYLWITEKESKNSFHLKATWYILLCFVVRYFMSIPVLQLSWWGRESWLLCLICLPGVLWWLSGSSSRCHGGVCGLWLWYFLIILNIFLRYCQRTYLKYSIQHFVNYTLHTYYTIDNEALLNQPLRFLMISWLY